MKGTRKTTYRPPNSSSLPTMRRHGVLVCTMAHWDQYTPYGRSVGAVRGGIDVIWLAFPNTIPNTSQSGELIRQNTVVIKLK